MSTTEPAVREGEYGDRVAAVEPGGLEFIPLPERHGRPLDLLWTWMSPNLEFATVFLGVLAVAPSATFGYAAGWNPYAADYTRYLPPGSSRRAVGLSAGLGVFISCVALEIMGAASATIGGDALGQPTTAFTGHLPGLVANLTLLAIALGAISANALNVYSGAMSLLALGVRLPLTLRRAIVALACGVAGFLVALSGLEDAGHKYEAFLLIIAYWIGPWLGVVLADRYLRRDRDMERLLFDTGHVNWAGPIAMVAGVVLSVWLFSNQERYVGLVPSRVPEVGDIAFEVGFVISAAVYAALRPLRR